MATLRALLILGLAAGLAGGCAPDKGPAAVGERFPALRLAALDSGGGAEEALPRGRNVVLNVWATWCEPCRREMAGLERLARERGDLEVVGVSVDGDANLAREFLLAQGVRFANYSDPGGHAVRDALGVQALPQTFVVARDGIVVARIAGPRDWTGRETRSMLRDALALSEGASR